MFFFLGGGGGGGRPVGGVCCMRHMCASNFPECPAARVLLLFGSRSEELAREGEAVRCS